MSGLPKIDLHTHSLASPDGSLKPLHYRSKIESKQLDCIAVTDHNTIEFGLVLQAELGTDRIIVGEEITTTEGDIVGLYLQETILPGESLADTVRAIRRQGGLVYVPHPFETVRQGLGQEVLETIADQVDIIEVYNGRAVFQNRSRQALTWAAEHAVVAAASSDAHGASGWGRTYTELSALPSRDTLVALLAEANYRYGFPGVRGMLYPKYNRLRNRNVR